MQAVTNMFFVIFTIERALYQTRRVILSNSISNRVWHDLRIYIQKQGKWLRPPIFDQRLLRN